MKKYHNYCSNLEILSKAADQDLENEFIISGIVDKFFIQFELGWKLMKELMKYEGVAAANTGSPREIIKEAYKIYDFMGEDIWLEMLRARNDMAHLYDGKAARELVQNILHRYIPEFNVLRDGIERRYGDDLEI